MSTWNYSSLTVGLKHAKQTKHAFPVRRAGMAVLGCSVHGTPAAGRKTEL